MPERPIDPPDFEPGPDDFRTYTGEVEVTVNHPEFGETKVCLEVEGREQGDGTNEFVVTVSRYDEELMRLSDRSIWPEWLEPAMRPLWAACNDSEWVSGA